MKQPALVIMAAGMGSRFGGLKQIEPVDEQGHIIMDFSLFDAYRAGFREIVFIIKPELEEAFRERIGERMEKYFKVTYVYQTLDKLPEGYVVPEERVKPWGTGHAIACCKDAVQGPFAVINADDFYGPGAFRAIYDFLVANEDPTNYAMVGYRVRNTVTEHGSVARGVCTVENGKLVDIVERTKIFKKGDDAEFTEDGETFVHLPGDTLVSMNLFGFTSQMMEQLVARFPAFLDASLPVNPLKCEYFLPSVVSEQLDEGLASVDVLPCEEVWYGVTYREDLVSVREAIARMKEAGVYTKELWT